MSDRKFFQEEVTLEALFTYMRGLDQALRDHMRQEEDGMRSLRGEISAIEIKVDEVLESLKTLDKVVWSMPEDKHGKPSFYQHKNDHTPAEEKEPVIADRRADKKDRLYLGFKASELRMYFFMLSLLMIATGHADLFFKLVAKFVGM